MTRMSSSPLFLAVIGFCLQAAPANAQLSRTFVSAGIGNDANDCSRAAPCRTFQAAHNKTNAEGEITVLDTGGYGGLVITKSISIVNDGVGEASILVSGGGTGIDIQAGPASYINLRGIIIQGIGFGGSTGLLFETGFALTMTNCVIRNHTGNGLQFSPRGDSRLAVSNTLLADNGAHGVQILPGNGGPVRAVFHRIATINNSVNGLLVDGDVSSGTIRVLVTDSVSANNGLAGFSAGSFQADTFLVVVGSQSANNAVGFAADGAQASVVLGRSTVAFVLASSGGGVAWSSTNNGGVGSFGDNHIFGSGNANLFPLAKK